MSARERAVVRVALGLLALSQAVVGVWALLAPQSFYDGFPAAGHAWVALLPPYNEHLVRDVGGLSLAMTVVLVAAAWWLDRRLAWVAVIAFAVWTVPHAAFHVTHLEGFTSVDATLQTLGFVLQLGVTAVIAVVLARSGRRMSRAGVAGGDLTRRGSP